MKVFSVCSVPVCVAFSCMVARLLPVLKNVPVFTLPAANSSCYFQRVLLSSCPAVSLIAALEIQVCAEPSSPTAH